ncbi:MAG: type VI secretion system baseplate subunit TssE [Casimicrobiaceae bacterium]|nr:type VI secretion system baseplate subunit TssE [Casimicrobiaceae bacterium]MCX8097981.1 type VI secretion system baseplate subunit TssE [Casimicrobiaceae bacterium]MDW8311724.1 type VI secretion system baseplate subunit TssE [Burkholderiales bacterium]
MSGSNRTASGEEERAQLLAPADRLQPALLDRLTDDEPHLTSEPVTKAVVSKARLKRTVLRDISWLLNTTAHDVHGELKDYPEVRRSVLNYGIPVVSGKSFSEITWNDLERAIREALIVFEPRLLRDSLQIRALSADNPLAHHNQIEFEIRAELWSVPFPVELLVRSQLDLETRIVQFTDVTGSTAATPSS